MVGRFDEPECSMRVALVEPSRTVRRIVTDTIAAWGHGVSAFDDAQEALGSLAANKDIRALITSTVLPMSSGIQLVRDARMLVGTRRPLYILLMSSTEERSKVVEALDSGADDFISKPPALEELRAKLCAADRITSMQADLIQLATTDALTGLLNRRAFVERLEDCIRSEKNRVRASVLIGDLDKFKAINDSFGHEVGDRVLKTVSNELKTLNVPVGRLGGEEFAVLLSANLEDAIEVAEHLRESIGSVAVGAGSDIVEVTCSFGAAEWEPGDTVDTIFRRADMALYEAKRLGRNRAIAADGYQISEAHQRWRGIARLRKSK
jgi:two-component system cell cycle response regulator